MSSTNEKTVDASLPVSEPETGDKRKAEDEVPAEEGDGAQESKKQKTESSTSGTKPHPEGEGDLALTKEEEVDPEVDPKYIIEAGEGEEVGRGGRPKRKAAQRAEGWYQTEEAKAALGKDADPEDEDAEDDDVNPADLTVATEDGEGEGEGEGEGSEEEEVEGEEKEEEK